MGWSAGGLRGIQVPWLPIALVAVLGVAAVVVPARPLVLMGLLVTYGLARSRDRHGSAASAIAAVMPVAAILAWGAIPQPVAQPLAGGGSDCTDPTAPPAVWRFLEALVGLAMVTLLVIDRRSTWAALGLRLGSRRNALIAAVALLVVTPVALFGGGILGQPGVAGSFFGPYRLDLSQPAAFLPAALFAVSNALAEELAYRGAMRTWLIPGLGVVGANLAQAIVFGLAHTGQDFVGPVVPTVAAMIAAGFVAGVIARRTNSLAIVLAVHAAADIPLFFYWACRVA
ncbi:MAG TPA: type II CAAX endopeptidase family protein [Candidatus Limnocylindrales bacterium]